MYTFLPEEKGLVKDHFFGFLSIICVFLLLASKVTKSTVLLDNHENMEESLCFAGKGEIIKYPSELKSKNIWSCAAMWLIQRIQVSTSIARCRCDDHTPSVHFGGVLAILALSAAHHLD